MQTLSAAKLKKSISVKIAIFGCAALLAGCAGRDQPRSLSVTQDCQGTCTSTITIAPVVDPVLTATIPVSALPGGLP